MVDHIKLDEDWPTYLHKKLKEDWVLSRACRENCECYFLRHWETKYLFQNFSCLEDSVQYLGNQYKMIFIPNYGEVCASEQVALSFRKPLAELNLPAYVLVKGIENKS